MVLICVAGWFGRSGMSCPSVCPMRGSCLTRSFRHCDYGPFAAASWASPRSRWRELLGLSRETVSRWWTAYAEDGVEALPGERTGRPVGSGRTLIDGQAAWLRTILNQKSPEEVGIASPLWTRRAVADLIRKQFGIDMPVRTVGEYLRRWGYTVKVPRRHAKDQDP